MTYEGRGLEEMTEDSFESGIMEATPKMYSVVFKIVKNRRDSEDIVQEAYTRAWDAYYDGKFRHESSLSTWLCRIAYNLAIDLKRKQQRSKEFPLEFDEHPILGRLESPVEDAEARERMHSIVDEELAKLPEHHRNILIMYAKENMLYKEIAAELGVTIGTVMSRLHYARKKIVPRISRRLESELGIIY